jgi:adenosylmethionine---8-amino-7-oxononanoate aminotransferase
MSETVSESVSSTATPAYSSSLDKDASPIWRPFTQMQTALPPLAVKSGRGVYLELEDGRQIMDCISSWWVNLHGHGEPKIAEAIAVQAKKLEHVIFAGFTHEPAESLARRLLEKVPRHLERLFYSDNGSTAVEVALKIACQYWVNKGAVKRKRFIGFECGYHGDTVGAMSVGGSSSFWSPFKNLMFELDIVPYPATFAGDTQCEDKERAVLSTIEKLFALHEGTHAAIFIEPLIQGAGGMRMCRPEFLRQLQSLAQQNQVLIIYDEVMTGFGRTGGWFACTKSGTKPDILCLSKGITGGFLPLAVTLTTEEIFSQFLSDDSSKTFFHGHSYTANPIACAAANASLTLLENNTAVFENMQTKHQALAQEHLLEHPMLKCFRVCGTVAAFDVVTSEGTNYFDDIGRQLREKFLQAGFLIRPLGNTVYLMPPYCIETEQLASAYAAIALALDSCKP